MGQSFDARRFSLCWLALSPFLSLEKVLTDSLDTDSWLGCVEGLARGLIVEIAGAAAGAKCVARADMLARVTHPLTHTKAAV